MEHYTGIEVQTSKKFCNPLRDDRRPGAQFSVSASGKIRLLDYADEYWHGSDCFDIVMKLYRISFTEACHRIIAEMSVMGYTPPTKTNHPYRHDFNPNQTRVDYEWAIRKWNKYDAEYWKSIPISRKTLDKWYVYPCSWVKMKTERGDIYVHVDRPDDLCYAYYYGKGDVKFMMPFREKKLRFRGNTRYPHGLLQMPVRGEEAMLIKSQKDAMWMDEHMGIPCFGPQGESYAIDRDPILKNRLPTIIENFDRVWCMYDFDRAGAHGMWVARKEYGLKPLIIGNGRFGTRDAGEKDVTDISRTYGVYNAIHFIHELMLTA